MGTPTRRIDALVASTDSLFHSLTGLTDDAVRDKSLLPGWSRGHVLTHLARNADAMMNLVTWAKTGQETPMYASRKARNAAIEEGAGRPATELVADVRATHERMLADLQALPDDAWSQVVRWGAAEKEGGADVIPLLRRTEVEIHHVDLDLDYTLAHLPEDFVEAMLDEVTADYSKREDMPGVVLIGNDDEGRWTVEPGGPEVVGAPPALLGWLLGRTEGIGLHAEGGLPSIGAWR